MKQPSSQWVIALFLPAHCEKGSKDGFCHRRLIKDAVALHNELFIFSPEFSAVLLFYTAVKCLDTAPWKVLTIL